MKKLITVLALISISGATRSQPADTPVGAASLMAMDGDRGRFQIERMRIESRFEKEHAACYARFAVTDCLAQVRRHRREVLDILRRQEIALNDAERQRKALEQPERNREASSARRIEAAAIRRFDAHEAQQERDDRAKQKTLDVKSGSIAANRARKTLEAGRSADDIANEKRQYQNKLDQARVNQASREKSNRENAATPAKPLPVFRP